MLIVGGKDRQVYDCTTPEGEFRLFVKYRSKPIDTITSGYSSWQFTFCDKDKSELSKYIKGEKPLSLGLVYGQELLRIANTLYSIKRMFKKYLVPGRTR